MFFMSVYVLCPRVWPLVDGNALQTLAENCTEMQLEKLFLKSCDQLTNDGIISFIDVQRNLQVLDLSLSVRLTDLALMHICESK